MSNDYQGPAALVLLQDAQGDTPEAITRVEVDVLMAETFPQLFRVSTTAAVPALATADRVRVTLPDGRSLAGFVTWRQHDLVIFRLGKKPEGYV